MLRSFDVAADQIVSLIEEERADASEVSRQQLLQAQNQFNAFRNAAFTTHATNEAINVQCRQEIEKLTRKAQELQELEYTLHKAGIYHSHGFLAFGGQWGALVRGLRPTSPNLPQGPFLLPRDVAAALETQRRAEDWQRVRDSAEIARLENLVRWYRDFHETKYPDASLIIPLGMQSFSLFLVLTAFQVEGKSLKREMASSEVPEHAAKRFRLDAQVEQWGTAPTFNATPTSNFQPPAFSPSDCVTSTVWQSACTAGSRP
jgi:hypothetical protein